MPKNKYTTLLAISLVIIIALLFVQDFAEFLDQNSSQAISLGSNQQCDPGKSICSASIIEDGEIKRISLSITPPIITAKKFPVTLKVTGFDFEGIVSAELLFKDWDNENLTSGVSFTAIKQAGQIVAENWQAQAMLPATGASSQDWAVIITIKTTEKEYQAEFTLRKNSLQ